MKQYSITAEDIKNKEQTADDEFIVKPEHIKNLKVVDMVKIDTKIRMVEHAARIKFGSNEDGSNLVPIKDIFESKELQVSEHQSQCPEYKYIKYPGVSYRRSLIWKRLPLKMNLQGSLIW